VARMARAGAVADGLEGESPGDGLGQGGRHPRAMAKQPASWQARASAKRFLADSGSLPWRPKPPREVAVRVVRPKWPMTGKPDLTAAPSSEATWWTPPS
jgi:hypothetical protein